VSFYPAHHMTMGEGGAVMMRSPALRKIVESFRDWGRDCWCEPGKDNTCGKRFEWQLGDLPHGYDHKYTYSRIGYNLKVTDMQAAVGVAQLEKLDGFIQARVENARRLSSLLAGVEWLALPGELDGGACSWFGYPIRLLPGAPVSRDALANVLNERKIGTRLLFAGNILKQPAYRGVAHRAVGSLERADEIMNSVLWVGVHPGLSADQLAYIAETITSAGRLAPV
jgi:CDP-6-deoxy-D-xylo-4-hexulose-3-dehydrase